jgi:hypothetical protein
MQQRRENQQSARLQQAQAPRRLLQDYNCCDEAQPTIKRLTESLMESFRTLGNEREASSILLQCIYTPTF